MNQIELGRVRLYADELVIICRELNCSPMHIPTEGLAGTIDCPMTLFAQLPAERQRLVLDLMRELCGEPGHRQLELHKRLNELTDDQIAHIEAIVSDSLFETASIGAAMKKCRVFVYSVLNRRDADIARTRQSCVA